MIDNSRKLNGRLLGAVLLSLAAGCSVSASGQIPCADDSSCPADYPVCSAGKCISGTSSTGPAAVSIVGVSGKAPSDPLRGTVTVQVVARASSGVKSLTLDTTGKSYTPDAGSTGPVYTFTVDTTKLPDGSASFTATVTPGDPTQSAKTSAAFGLLIDNTAPTLTATSLTPPDVRSGMLVKVDVTSSKPLASISGTVTLAGTPSGFLAEIAPSDPAGSGRTYHLGFAVTSATAAGSYSISIAAKDLAGNDAVPATQSFNVRGSFSFSAMTLGGTTVVSSLPAGTTGGVITVSVSVPTTVPVGTAAPTFTLVDASGAPRTFSGTPTLATSAGVNTWTLASAVAAGDASGTAIVTASIADVAGNVAMRSANYLIDRTPPQAGAVSLTPAYVEGGDTITVTAVASKALKAAALTTSSGETGASCLCNSGACADSTSATPTVTCTATVATTATTSSIAVTDTLVLTDTVGNVSAASAANQAHYTILPHPSINDFSSADATINGGSSTKLTAVFAGGLGTIVDDKSSSPIGIVSGSPLTIAPSLTTTYTLQVTNLAGKTVNSLPVTVQVAAPPGFTGNFTVSPTIFTVGDPGNMTFTAPAFPSTATAAITGPGITTPLPITSGNTATLAKSVLMSAGTYTYTLTATNAANASNSVTVAVTVVGAPGVTSGSLTVSPTSITSGDAGSVTFTAPTFNSAVTSAFVATTNNATGCTTGIGISCAFITSGATATLPKPGSGTSQSYFLYVQNANQKLVQPASQTTSVSIVGAPGSTGTFSVSPTIITTGEGGSLTFTAPATFTNVSNAAVTKAGESVPILAGGTAALPKPVLAAGASAVYTLTLNNSVGTQTDVSKTVSVSAVAAPSIASGSFSVDTTLMTVGENGAITFTAPTFATANGAFSAPPTLSGTPSSGSASIANGGTNNTFVTKGALSTAGPGSYAYTITASNTATIPAQLARTVTINVFAAPAVLNGTLSVSPSAIVAGDTSGNITFTAPTFNAATTSAFLSTTASGATSGTAIASGGIATLAKPGATTTYYLYLKNAVGTGAGIVNAQTVTVTAVGAAGSTGPFFVSASPTIKLGDTTTQITFTLPATLTNVTSSSITAPGVALSAGTTAGGNVNLPTTSNPQSTTTYTFTGANAVSSTTPLTTTVLVGESIAGASLTAARYGAAAVLLNDGRVLVAGGSTTSDGANPVKTAVIYDPVAGTYTPTSNTMSVSRYRSAAVVLTGTNAGKVLIQGGSATEATNDIFDPTAAANAGAFSNGGNISAVRCGGVGAVEVVSGTVLVAGGSDCAGTDLNTVEFAGVSGNNTTANFNMTTARRGLTATLITTGSCAIAAASGVCVLLAGGNTTSATADVMTFVNANSGGKNNSTFASIAATRARQYQTAMLLTNGKVLIAGGTAASMNTAEIYDPTTGNGTFTATANEMAGHPINAAAIRTSTGLVLIVNGENGSTGTLNTTEFYDPGNNRWAPGPVLSIARTQLFAVEMARDLALVAGGTGNNTSTTTPTDVLITP